MVKFTRCFSILPTEVKKWFSPPTRPMVWAIALARRLNLGLSTSNR